ncbi:MAG: hypothetical protein IJM25_08035 [Eubacterium sp.]|nr:hypothetical protein [Eubacterium sp.]
MDKYKERLVKGRPGKEVFGIMAAGVVLIAAAVAVMLLVHSLGFFLIPIGVVLIMQGVQHLHVEFEYLIVNGDIEIDRIVNKNSRKILREITVENIQRIAPLSNDRVKNDLEVNNRRKVIDYTEGADSGMYYVVFERAGEKETAYILDLDEECLQLLEDTPALKRKVERK